MPNNIYLVTLYNALYELWVSSSGSTTFTGLTVNGNLNATTISATTYLNLPSSTFSGGTVTGPTIFSGGLSATTFSATTYLGLPIDVYITGGTFSSGTATFTNNTGGTFNVTGFGTGSGDSFTGGTVTGATDFTNGLTANTISATSITSITYYGLPIDVYVTGGTYSTGTATFTNNTGGTFSVSGFSTSTGGSFTGGTVTGATDFTNGITANTISSGGTDLNAIFVQPNTVQTITNKRISKRVVLVASSATPAFNTNNGDIARLTGLTTNITNASTNLSGTPSHGDMFSYEITDNGVARTLSWGASFAATGTLALPTTTVISTHLRCLFQYDDVALKWEIVAVV